MNRKIIRPTQICQHCGNPFTPKYWSAKPQEFCGVVCRNKVRTRPLAERFWEKVNKTDTCWLWTGAIRGGGYGVLGTKKYEKCANAHHVSWELHNGPVPEGLWVLHQCDVRHCVNPKHLFLGTLQDNNLDKAKKGRAGKKLTPDDVRTIRSAIANGNSNEVLAADFGVSRATINLIRRGLIWKYI